MKIGYARVSTIEQNLDLQIDALKAAGCEKNFSDVMSGAKSLRPELLRLKEQLRPGDTLVVWRLDRLGRSMKDLLEWMTSLEQMNVGLVSLKENIDTTTPTGRLVFHLFASLAEFERNLIVERTMAGLSAARARGRTGGRPFKLNDKKRQLAREMYDSKKYAIKDICDTLQVSKPTLYKYLSKA